MGSTTTCRAHSDNVNYHHTYVLILLPTPPPGSRPSSFAVLSKCKVRSTPFARYRTLSILALRCNTLKLRSQAPRFGNGRTIADLAKRVFTEIAMRASDGGGNQAGDQGHHHASTDDIRRAAVAILQQMTKVDASPISTGANSTPPAPAAAFSTSTSTARETAKPKATASTVALRKRPRKVEEDESDENRSDAEGPFLSNEDRETLLEACNIAGIPTDSPDLGGGNAECNEGLRRALILPGAESGIGFSAAESESFLRRVAADRAALSRLGRTDSEGGVEDESDVADAERELQDAEAEAKTAGAKGDDDLLALLLLAKRAKEEAVRRAKEEMERRKVLELTAQTALRRMGVCPAGFKWLRQGGGGWRCTGGTHYVSDGAVAAEITPG